MFYWSVEEEESEEYLFAVRLVMLMIRLILSEALIYLILMASIKMSVNCANHLLFILHIYRSDSLIHIWIVIFISG